MFLFLAVAMFALALQSSSFRSPVTVRCELDTDLPLDEIRVSLNEKPELKAVAQSDGSLTLPSLPEGDLHLSFFQKDASLGEVAIRATESGDFIRLRVRLVPGNAILLDEFRIRGLSDTPEPSSKSAAQVQGEADEAPRLLTAPSRCPAPGEAVSVTGTLTRIIDHDAFELQTSNRQIYVVYVGTATRLQRGSTRFDYADLEKGMRLLLKGTVAAGPEEECSIGAKEITVQRP